MAEAQIKISAKDDASNVLKRLQAEFDQTASKSQLFSSALAGLSGGALAGLSFAGFVSFAKIINDGVDALNDLKDATGASIPNLSALEDIGARTGHNFDTVSKTLVKFNSVLTQTQEAGSDASRIFQALGLDAQKLRNEDPAEALRQTAVALAGFADNGDKARAVQELFGKSVREMAPFLADLAEQTSLQGRVSAEAAAEADKFNKELFKMQAEVIALARSVAGPAVSSINAMIDLMRDGETAASAFVRASAPIATVFETIAVLAVNGAYVLQTFGKEIGAMAAQLAALGRGDFAGAGFIRESWIADAKVARAEVDALSARILGAQQNAQNLSKSLGDVDTRAEDARLRRLAGIGSLTIPAKQAAGAKEADSAFDALNKRIQEQLALQEQQLLLGRELTQVEQFLLKVRTDAAASKKALSAKENQVLEANLAEVVKRSNAIDIENRQRAAQLEFVKQMGEARADEAKSNKLDEDRINARNAAGNKLLNDLRSEIVLIGMTNEQREVAIALRQLEAAGFVKGTEAFESYAKELTAALELKKQAEKARKEFDDIVEIGADLVQGKTDSIKRFFEEIVREAIKMRVIKPILNDIFGINASTGLGGLFGAGGSGLAGSLSGLGGAIFDDFDPFGFIKSGLFFADGGRPPMGKASMVGERGPELFVPDSPGTIIPNNKLGGVSLSTSITVNGGGNKAEVASMIGQALRVNNEQWSRQLSAAGVLR